MILSMFCSAATIFGQLGIPVNITGLKQEKVPTMYVLGLNLFVSIV